MARRRRRLPRRRPAPIWCCCPARRSPRPRPRPRLAHGLDEAETGGEDGAAPEIETEARSAVQGKGVRMGRGRGLPPAALASRRAPLSLRLTTPTRIPLFLLPGHSCAASARSRVHDRGCGDAKRWTAKRWTLSGGRRSVDRVEHLEPTPLPPPPAANPPAPGPPPSLCPAEGEAPGVATRPVAYPLFTPHRTPAARAVWLAGPPRPDLAAMHAAVPEEVLDACLYRRVGGLLYHGALVGAAAAVLLEPPSALRPVQASGAESRDGGRMSEGRRLRDAHRELRGDLEALLQRPGGAEGPKRCLQRPGRRSPALSWSPNRLTPISRSSFTRSPS